MPIMVVREQSHDAERVKLVMNSFNLVRGMTSMYAEQEGIQVIIYSAEAKFSSVADENYLIGKARGILNTILIIKGV